MVQGNGTMTGSALLEHPAVKEHLSLIASGKRQLWDPVDYAAVDVPALIVGEDGEIHTNEAKYGAKLQLLPVSGTLEPNVAAMNELTMSCVRPGVEGGDTEFLGFTALSDGRFVCLPKSQSLNIDLANNPVPNNLLFASGMCGGPWGTTFYEPGDGAVLFDCFNRINTENNVEICGVGRRFVGAEAQATIDARRAKFLNARINPYFLYPDAIPHAVEFVLPAGQTLDLEMTLPSTGDTLITSIRDDSTRQGGGIPNFKVNIQDGINGWDLTAEPVSVRLIAAMSMLATDPRLPAAAFDGPLGGLLTHVFPRSGVVNLTFESFDNADITVRFGFPSVILRYKPAPNRNTNNSMETRQRIIDRGQPLPFRNIVQGGRS